MIPTRIGQQANGMTFAAVMHYCNRIGLLLVANSTVFDQYESGYHNSDGKQNCNVSEDSSDQYCPSRDEMAAVVRSLSTLSKASLTYIDCSSVENSNCLHLLDCIPSIIYPRSKVETVTLKFIHSTAALKLNGVYNTSTRFIPRPDMRVTYSVPRMCFYPFHVNKSCRLVSSITICRRE